MSREIALIIDGVKADVNQDTPISFTYSIESAEPGKVSGSFSKRSINLPATTNNRQIFENIEQGETIVTTSNKLLPASASVGGIPILNGKVQLNRSSLISNGFRFKPSNYQVTFIGANADWFSDIANVLIRSLQWPTVELTTTNYDNLGDANPANDDTCFVLIKWQAWKEGDKVDYVELSPALFVNAILRRAFQLIGYKLESIFDSDPFNRIIVPLPLGIDPDYVKKFVNLRATGGAVEVSAPEGFVDIPVPFDDDSTEPNFDGGNNFNLATGEYVAPTTALYAIRVDFSSSAFLSGVNYTVNIKVNGVVKASLALSSSSIYSFEYIGDLNAGDVVSISVIGVDVPLGTPSIFLSDWIIQVEAEKEEWKMGETMDLAYLIPGTWFVRDLIKDLTKVFNLNWQTDVLQRKVFAYPKDRAKINHRINATGAGTTTEFEGFYLRDEQTDITRKVDLGVGGEMTLIDSRKQDYVLAWGTGDPTAEELEKRAAASLYSARYRHSTDRYPAGSDWVYTEFYAKTIHINDADISDGPIAVQVPLLFGKNYFEEDDAKADWTLNPRLLYFAGRRSGDDGYVRMYNATTSATTTGYDYPCAFMVNYNDSSASDFSLSYCDEVTNYGGVVKGLYKSLHLQQQSRIEEGRVYDVNVFWDELDISSLSFRKALTIRGVRYLLEKIDGYQPGKNQSTKTTLFLDKVPTLADAARVSGPVALEGASQNGLTSLGSVNGVVNAPQQQSARVVRYYELFENANSRVITIPSTSGILAVINPYVAMTVAQNGKLLYPELEYTISGNTLTIEEFTHFDGANYLVKIYDVI
jgi:hypothetical protein